MNSENFRSTGSTEFNDLGLNQQPQDQPEDLSNSSAENKEIIDEEYGERGKETLEAKKAIEDMESKFAELEKAYIEMKDQNPEEAKAVREAMQKLYQEIAVVKGDIKEAEEADKPSAEEVESTINKWNNNKGKSKWLVPVIIAGVAITLAAVLALTFGGSTNTGGDTSKGSRAGYPSNYPYAVGTTVGGAGGEVEEEEINPYAGELANGVTYDYEEYADRFEIADYGDDWEEEAKSRWGDDYIVVRDKDGNPWGATGKEAWNAYGHDYSEDFEDREAATEHIMAQATKSPEILASYVYYLFTDAEKEEFGIKDITPKDAKLGVTMTDIDDYIGSHEDGNGLREKLLEKLEQILNSDKTSFVFYNENDTEETNYLYFVDEDENGKMDPTEVHLGYDTRERNEAPQVDIYRSFYDHSDKNGDYYKKKKMIDLNMECGYQPNDDQTPPGVPKIPGNPTDPGSAGAEGSG
ncbi:hypothetical protein IKD57_01585, partial [Candidatus Saccharibacteria bacterium]|nr:hypothetical protein [Candidatus Saccharibacteria bacterium]